MLLDVLSQRIYEPAIMMCSKIQFELAPSYNSGKLGKSSS